jgi:signal transduction histidine kinase
MIKLSSGSGNPEGAVQEMGEIHHQLTTLMRALPAIQNSELSRRGLIEALQVTIDNEFRSYFNTLVWQVDDNVSKIIESIPAYASEVLFHATREAVRNAAHHGRQSETDQLINLSITMTCEDGLTVRIYDDGIGFNPSINNENFGQGLALHSTLMAVVGGSMSVESIPNRTTQVIINLPV